MKILALDISSTSTGHAVFNNGRLTRSSLGTVRPTQKMMGHKLIFFAKEIKALIDKHQPDVVVIEDIFRGPNIKTFKTLAMFRGVAFYIINGALGQDPVSIMPTEARRVAGVGGNKKEDGFKFAKKKYSLAKYNFDDHNDITDAVVLGLAYHVSQRDGIEFGKKRPKRRRRRRNKK